MSTYVKRGRPKGDDHQRFWSKVDRSGECWLWTAATDKAGRTKVQWDGTVQPANRVAWLLVRGAFPTHPLRNICGNPRCVNPEHWQKPRYSQRPMTASQRKARWWQRFRSRVALEIHVAALGPCWVWQRYVDPNGYGKVSFRGKSDFAHRAAYIMTMGEIPEGLELDHLCRNRTCCNPDHLEAVTHRVNLERSPLHIMFNDGLRHLAGPPRKTHCKRGHELTPDNRVGPRQRCGICQREVARRAYERIMQDPEKAARVRERRRIRYEREKAQGSEAA